MACRDRSHMVEPRDTANLGRDLWPYGPDGTSGVSLTSGVSWGRIRSQRQEA